MTLKGHQGAITAVRFSIDGKRLVTTSVDKTARVWDLENAGAAIRQLEGTSKDWSFVARFSSDGHWIAAASGNRVRLWDAATGRLVRELSAGANSSIFSVAFSPTDNRLLAVGYGGQADVSCVALWDIDAGTELVRLPGATDLPGFPASADSRAVGALAFSPDGKYLVAGFGVKWTLTPGGPPRPLKVWEVANRRQILLNGHTGYCISLDFSRDGKLLASGSRDGTAILWSTATWKRAQTLQNPDNESLSAQSGRGMVEGVAFSPDGKTLAMASREGNVHLWDVASGKLLKTLKGHSSAVNAVVFSPDGRTLASGSTDHTVRLWNVQTRRQLMQLDPGNIELGDVGVLTLAFSPDGMHLLAGGVGDSFFWSAAPIVWNDPVRAAEKLHLLLQSNADFLSRIGMLCQHARLYEALEKLEKLSPNDVRVQIALAVARARRLAAQGNAALAEAARTKARLLLEQLFKHHPQAAAGLGDLYAAEKDWEQAIAEYRKLVTGQPADDALLNKLAAAYRRAGRTREAVPYLARTAAAHPDNTLLFGKVAALQAWFGQDKELADTCRQGLALAKNTSVPETADRVAKACCLLPSTGKAPIEAALALARKAVQLGEDSPNLPWFQMALGMAEYRSGHFAQADAALIAAAKGLKDNPTVTGTSAFYRAMSLFRQGKKDEARKLAIETAAQMKPLPKDEQNPLANDGGPDDLILWLAYKEAQALIGFDASPTAPMPQEKK